jgi:predicted TIM-barrel fold metal-dependent hydrolase
MMRNYSLISADSHINEPPELFVDGVPARFRDRAPHMERFELGDAWIMEGALDPIHFGGNCCAGLPAEQRSPWVKWEDVRPGGSQPGPRLLEQDQDGVEAEILYPTPRVSNQVFWEREDPEFHLACIRAYNDWLADYCAYDPERLWGVALVPNVGVAEAVAEVERITDRPGMNGVMLGLYPHGDESIEAGDDALWATLAERQVPVSVHVGFVTGPQGDHSRMKLTGSLRFFDAPIRATQFVESGVFDRFPDLRLILAEVDSSWLPYMREQMDDRFKRTMPSARPQIDRLPSEYFTDNILSTFITDRYGVQNRHSIGVSQMMWSSDYPHTGADWPESMKTIDDHFEGVAPDERAAILAGNALRVYGGTMKTQHSVGRR